MSRLAIVLLLALAAASCAPVKAATPEALRTRLEAARRAGAVGGERLRRPETVAKFYEGRKFEAAWTSGSRPDQVVEAIRGAARDGLDPADYHLEAIEAARGKAEDPEATADLDLLLTDAVANLVDDLRYGRVRPVSLDPSWNVDPREGAPRLDSTIAVVAKAGNPATAIDAERPDHFIYRGLVESLAKFREIEAKGGLPRVPAGKALKPGARDRRVAAVRARLAVTGEVPSAQAEDSTLYDPQLVEGVKLFQQHHRLHDDGVLDAGTVAAMNVPAAARAAQVRVNLERARWVLPGLKDDFLLVNLPAFKAYLIRGGRNVWETRTMIGDEARQTPAFRSTMKTVVFNPDWTVPPTILEKDVLEGIRKGEDMIAKKQLVILDAQGNEVDKSSVDWDSATPEDFPYTLRQPPGDDNALGKVKFLFPNRHSIYLHDTPTRELFDAEKRTFSSGCIRVENPLDLARRLLEGQWDENRIQQALASGKTTNVAIEHPIPVLIVYWTVSVGATGEVRYMSDFYNLDRAVLAALDRGSSPRVSQRTKS